MANRTLPKRRSLFLLGALALLTAASPARELQLKERDHEKLGELIGEYFQAKAKSSGIADALEDLTDAIAKIEKKTKGMPFLSMVADIQQALYYSHEYKDGVAKGRPAERSFPNAYADLGELEYQVRAPKRYKASKGPYALMICLPDEGETAEEHIENDWVDGDLLDNVILAALEMPEDQATWNELRGGVGNALQMLRDVKNTYAVDVDRVYVAGRGRTVDTAMRVAAIFPHVFAGVIGRAGDMGETPPTNFRNLPTFFAGGGANCSAFQEAAKAAGIENCTVKADATEADIWAWLQETRRDPHPMDVSLSPANSTGRSAYWVEVEGFDPEEHPKIRATIDRASNTIRVHGTGISSVRLYFNDLLVDLDKPVVVYLNGVKHEISVPRRLDVALTQAFVSGDPGRAYVNSYFFDLSEKAEEEQSEESGDS